MRCKGWEIRGIYEAPLDEVLRAEPFFRAFGKVHDVNGHALECIATRPNDAMLSGVAGRVEYEGLTKIDRVLLLHSEDVAGVSPNESLRLDRKLYRIVGVSTPIAAITRLDLQGVES